MSRYTAKKNNGNSVAYGYDRVCGYFYQEFDEEDDCIVDLDSMFNKLTGVKLAERLEDTTARKDHIKKCYLDLPF